uniref:Uncharacterized protein n=1 Tax=Chromera velia CCMP2878 TaxID=1169474 RepID=A0A0G4HLM9_9ALVE|eukprot:Cvel_28833.t1-p1 / transcript=Cvel_28833.t1 / gene=Cvel_28833 / organism=Chromera_velia_CCMP2878 / gene_product=hypothetical protein / transcript_product=hypothetical protein / location=Cvel_scaffold3847:719-6180(-) / protein_length=788 / sequence_SO=supercontig / SO=protein_coding / is_pseudo=false
MQISCRLDNRLDCGGSSRGPQHAIITDVDGVPFCLECALSELSSGEIAASRCLSLLSDVGKALRYSSTGTQQTLPLSGGDSPSPSPSLLLWLFRDSLFLQTAVGILGGRLKPGPEGNREGEWNRGGREGGENGERGLRVPRGLGGDVRALREVGNLPGVATQGGVSNVWQQRREKLYHTAAGQSTKEQHGSRFALPLKRKRGVSAEGVSREGEPQMAVQQTEGRTAERPTALSQQPDPLAALLELFHGLFVSCLRAVVACPSSSSSGNVRDPQGVAGGRWGPVSVQQRGGKAGVGRETGGGTRGALTDGLEEEEVEEICGSALLSIFAELDGLLISLEEDRQQERQQQAKEQKVAAGCVQRQGQKGGREARAGRERGLDRLLALLADMLTVGGKAKRPGAPLTASRGVRDWTSFGGGKLRGGRSGVRELSGGWQDKQERQASDNLYAKKRGEVPTSSSSTNRTEWNSCWGPPSSLNDFLSWVEDVEAKTESGGCGVEGGAGSRLDGCSEGRSGFPFTRLVLEDPRCCEALREIGAAVGSSARGREMIARICRVLLMPPPVGLDPGTSTEVAAVGGVLQSCSSGLAALLAASPPHSPLATFLMGLYDCCARLRIPTVPLAPPQLHRAAVTSPPLQPKRGLRGPSVLVQEETAPMSDGPRSRSRGAAPKGRPAQPQGRPKGLGQQSRSRKDPKRVLDFFDSESEEEEEDGEEERENENVEMINRTQQHMQTMDQGEKRKDGRFGEEEADLERQEREGQGDREAGKERQQEGQPLLLGCLCPVEILSTLGR